MRLNRIFPLLLIFSITTSSLFAQPQQTVRYEYYEVHGLTAAEIRKSLDEHQHRTHGFGGHDALTSSKLLWRGGPQPSVRADILYQLPKWVDGDQAPAELRETWKRFQKAILIHEDGHRQLIEDEVRAIEQMVIAAGPRPNRYLSRDVNVLMQSFDKKQQEYDKITWHGRTQGAVFNG